MSVKQAIVEHLPIPDPGNNTWIYLTATMVGNLSRSGNIYIFVLSLYAIVLFLIALLVFKITLYIISVYRERLAQPGKHRIVMGVALGIATVFFAVGFSMMGGDYHTNEQGRILISWTFGLFSLFVAAYDWWLDRPTAKKQPSLKGLTAEEVIKMHKTVAVARQGNG